MEKWKQVAKIFDNLGLAFIAAAVASTLKQMTDQSGQVDLTRSLGGTEGLIVVAGIIYVLCQMLALTVLGWIDEEGKSK